MKVTPKDKKLLIEENGVEFTAETVTIVSGGSLNGRGIGDDLLNVLEAWGAIYVTNDGNTPATIAVGLNPEDEERKNALKEALHVINDKAVEEQMIRRGETRVLNPQPDNPKYCPVKNKECDAHGEGGCNYFKHGKTCMYEMEDKGHWR